MDLPSVHRDNHPILRWQQYLYFYVYLKLPYIMSLNNKYPPKV